MSKNYILPKTDNDELMNKKIFCFNEIFTSMTVLILILLLIFVRTNTDIK